MEALDSTLYLSNDDLFLFARGEWYRSYEKMGAGLSLCRLGP